MIWKVFYLSITMVCYCFEDGSESVEESHSSDSEDGSTADSQVESDDECERESEDGSEESDRESSKSLEVERSREASAGTLCSLYCHWHISFVLFNYIMLLYQQLYLILHYIVYCHH